QFCEFAEPECRFRQSRRKAKGQIKLCNPTFLTFQTGKEAILQNGGEHRNWWSCGGLIPRHKAGVHPLFKNQLRDCLWKIEVHIRADQFYVPIGKKGRVNLIGQSAIPRRDTKTPLLCVAAFS